MLGVCIHTTTDNSAYDMTLQSQLAWSDHLPTRPDTYYLSVVGTSYKKSPIAYVYTILLYMLRALPKSVCGIDTSDWLQRGYDGLLTAYTQEYPKLGTLSHASEIVSNREDLCNSGNILPGIWYVVHDEIDHLSTNVEINNDCWKTVWRLCKAFQQQKMTHNNDIEGSADSSEVIIKSEELLARPDIQSVLWTLDDRPFVAFSRSHHLMVVGIVIGGAYILSKLDNLFRVDQTVIYSNLIAALIPVLVCLLLTRSVKSDWIETIFSLCRIQYLFCGIFQTTSTTTFGLETIALLFFVESLLLLFVSSPYDYSMPVTKSIIGLIVANAVTSNLVSQPLLYLLIALNASFIASRLSWLLSYKLCSMTSLPSAWKLLWSIVWLLLLWSSLIDLALLAYVNTSVSAQLAVFLLTIVFNKIRDTSDAFQVFFILMKKHV